MAPGSDPLDPAPLGDGWVPPDPSIEARVYRQGFYAGAAGSLFFAPVWAVFYELSILGIPGAMLAGFGFGSTAWHDYRVNVSYQRIVWGAAATGSLLCSLSGGYRGLVWAAMSAGIYAWPFVVAGAVGVSPGVRGNWLQRIKGSGDVDLMLCAGWFYGAVTAVASHQGMSGSFFGLFFLLFGGVLTVVTLLPLGPESPKYRNKNSLVRALTSLTPLAVGVFAGLSAALLLTPMLA